MRYRIDLFKQVDKQYGISQCLYNLFLLSRATLYSNMKLCCFAMLWLYCILWSRTVLPLVFELTFVAPSSLRHRTVQMAGVHTFSLATALVPLLLDTT